MNTSRTNHKLITGFILALLLLCVIPGALADKIDHANWMDYLYDFVPITEINMPGTHDSGTTYMRFTDSGYACCQDKDITGQLEMGMRVLDLRLDGADAPTQGMRVEYLMLNHNGYNCFEDDSWNSNYLYFSSVIRDVGWFLHDHPSETVVLVCAAEGEYGELAKKTLYEFAKDFRYNRESAPKGKDYPDFYDWYIKAYLPGDPVPTLEEVRGHAVIILNFGATQDGKQPEQVSVTKYEMNYQLVSDLGSDIFNKVIKIDGLIEDAVTHNWMIRYFEGDFDQWPTFRGENFKNEYSDLYVFLGGNPDVKYSGTNVTELEGFIDILSGVKGPRECAEEFWSLARGNNVYNTDILTYIKPGYRIGWITMDFPEMFPEFTDAIIRSNYVGFYSMHRYIVKASGIPHVPKKDITIKVKGTEHDKHPTITYEEDANGLVTGFSFEISVLQNDISELNTSISWKDGENYKIKTDRSRPDAFTSRDDILLYNPADVKSDYFYVQFDGPAADIAPATPKEFLQVVGSLSLDHNIIVSTCEKNTNNIPYISSYRKDKIMSALADGDVYVIYVANLPAYTEDGFSITYKTDGIVNAPADTPFDCTKDTILHLQKKSVTGPTPQTGDSAVPVVWACMLLGGAAVPVLFVIRYRSRHKQSGNMG